MLWGNTLYAREHPNEKDFLIPWLAAQTFLKYGDPASPERVTPYSDPATQRGQIIYYGRIAHDNEDPLILWLPFPLELFYFPFALISKYEIARGLWMTLCEIALIATSYLAVKLLRWKLPRFTYLLVLLFPTIWVFGLLSMISASILPLILLASVGALTLLESGQDELAGALLVFPLLNFGIFSVFILFVIWWAIYQRRWRVVAGLGMGLGILVLLSFILLPDWFLPLVKGQYWHLFFNSDLSTFHILGTFFPVAGPRIAMILTGLILILTFVEWRAVRQGEARHFLWTACLGVTVTPLIGLPIEQADYAALVLPLFLFFAILDERYKGGKLRSTAGMVAIFVVIVTYLVAFSATGALYLPVFILIGLYWMRWWAIRSPHPQIDR